jgi:hypothetical protein
LDKTSEEEKPRSRRSQGSRSGNRHHDPESQVHATHLVEIATHPFFEMI